MVTWVPVAPDNPEYLQVTPADTEGVLRKLADKATQAEAQEGTDDTQWMTPLRTADAIASQTALPLLSQKGVYSDLANIPTTIGPCRLSGRLVPGDGGGAQWVPRDTEPSHAGKSPSANGAWWEIAEEAIDPLMLAATGDAVADDSEPLLDALDVHRAIAGSHVKLTRIYGYSQSIAVRPNDRIEGIGRATSGLIALGTGSFHGIYGSPLNPPHNLVLRNFTVWAKFESPSTLGQYSGIRIHDARNILLENVDAYDGDAFCMWLIDCDDATVISPHVGASTEAKYLAGPTWGVLLDGCRKSRVEKGYGYRIGQGFTIVGDDSYRRTYAYVSSTANNELTCSDPTFFTQLTTGEEVRMFPIDGVGTMPGNVTDQTVYYAIKSGTEADRVIKLAASLSDALAATAIDITTAGSATNYKSRDNIALFQIDKNPNSNTATPDNTTDQIAVDATFYRSCTVGYPCYLTTTGTLPAGLSADKVYYVIRPTTNVIKLATSVANANLGTAVDFSDDGSGTLTLRLAKVSAFTRSGNNILFAEPFYRLLRTGDPIQFKSDGGSVPTGLTANTTYYVILIDTIGTIQVAATAADARAGTAITLSSDGSGTLMATLNTSYGASLSDAATRRPASENYGNRVLESVVDRHDSHAFNINGGQDNIVAFCVASNLEEYPGGPMAGGTLVARISFQIKHSSGFGTDRNAMIGCHAIRCGIGFGAQETVHPMFIDCVVDEAEYDGLFLNSADDAIIDNFICNRAKRYVVWGNGSNRPAFGQVNAIAHPNGTSILYNLDATAGAVIGPARHTGTFAFVLDIDSSSGFFDIQDGFRTRGLPISIVPTTGRYPINYRSGEIDLSVAAVTCLGPNPLAFHAARVTKTCVVATGGAPSVAYGRRDDTDQLVATAAPPTAADSSSVSMSPADASWVIAVNKTPALEVTSAGTGKIMVEYSGFATN